MLAVLRVRGNIGVRRDIEDTMKMLGLKKKHALAVLPRTDSIIGMIKKVESFVIWGELSQEMLEKFSGQRVINLKPPKKSFKSLKKKFPAGDLGYRGSRINELIARML